MPDLEVYEVGQSVTPVSFSALGHTFENDGQVHLLIGVAEAVGSKVVTVHAVRDCDARHGVYAGALVDYNVTIPEGGTWFSPAFSPYFYTGIDGKATVTINDVLGVNIAAFRVRAAR